MIEQYILHMQNQQKRRGIQRGELDFFDPKVLRKYRKLCTKTSANEKIKKPTTEKELRKQSQDIFSQRRASIGKFLANPENRRRSEVSSTTFKSLLVRPLELIEKLIQLYEEQRGRRLFSVVLK